MADEHRDVEKRNPVSKAAAAAVTHTEFFLTSASGATLFCHEWHSEAAPRDVVVIVQHGYADHSSRSIARIAETITATLGFHAFAMDAEGHGKSSGERAFIASWDRLLEDFEQFIAHAHKQHPNAPMFAVGESMGGAVVLDSSRRAPQQWRGMVLLAPMVRIADEAKPPSWQIPLFKGMARLLPKWAAIPEKRDIVALAFRSEEAQAAARADTLRYPGKVRLGTALVLLNASNDLEAHLEEITTPFLVLHGTGDMLTVYHHSVELHARAAATDKTMLSYEGAFHSLTDEPDGGGERVMGDLMDWLRRRADGEALSSPTPTPTDSTPAETPADSPADSPAASTL